MCFQIGLAQCVCFHFKLLEVRPNNAIDKQSDCRLPSRPIPPPHALSRNGARLAIYNHFHWNGLPGKGRGRGGAGFWEMSCGIWFGRNLNRGLQEACLRWRLGPHWLYSDSLALCVANIFSSYYTISQYFYMFSYLLTRFYYFCVGIAMNNNFKTYQHTCWYS